MSRSDLKNLIAQNDLEEVVENLFLVLSVYSKKNGITETAEYHDQLILLSGKLNGLKHQVSLGIIDTNFENLEKSRLNYSLLTLINSIPDNLFSSKELIESKHKKVVGLRSIVNEEISQKEFEFDLFLSFSSQDRIYAKKVWEQLRGYGLKVFLSEESLSLNIGESFFENIQHALLNSKHFVLICTPNSMSSEWVKVEYESFYNESFITNKGKRKLIILKGESFSKSQLPLFLKRLQIASNVEQILKSLVVGYSKTKEEKPFGSKKVDKKENIDAWMGKIAQSMFSSFTLIVVFSSISFSVLLFLSNGYFFETLNYETIQKNNEVNNFYSLIENVKFFFNVVLQRAINFISIHTGDSIISFYYGILGTFITTFIFYCSFFRKYLKVNSSISKKENNVQVSDKEMHSTIILSFKKISYIFVSIRATPSCCRKKLYRPLPKIKRNGKTTLLRCCQDASNI